MVVLNKVHWFKVDIGLRLWGIFIWLLGLIIYSWFVFAFYLEFARKEFENTFSSSIYLLKYLLFAPGFIPLVIGAFFLIFFRRPQHFFVGAFVILPIFIVLHYVVSVFEAHDDGWRYLCFQLFEIACAVVVIIKFSRKWKTIAETQESSG